MDDEPNEPPHDGKRGSTAEKHSEESKQEESHREDHETVKINNWFVMLTFFKKKKGKH